MQHGPPRRRRARPVADAPIDALLLRAEDLTKGWLLALLEVSPLDEAPAILATDLTRDGPRICEALVRALGDEDDLRRLEPGGALEPLVSRLGELAGASAPEPASRAVDALQGVIWSAIRAEARDADGDLVAELAERLALVGELVRGAALRRQAAGGAPPEVMYSIRAARAGSSPSGERDAAEVVQEPDALWICAVQDEIVRAQQLDIPLSLLLIELEDAERVRAAEEPAEATATFGRFAQALRGVVRRKDILVCETETRAWVIARETGRIGGQALATRLASAVSESSPWRGGPLTVNIGIGVLGEDGRDAMRLIEVAEEAKFAAAAAGVTAIHELPPEGSGGAGPRLVS
jgi:GGDEF domain-containing protein